MLNSRVKMQGALSLILCRIIEAAIDAGAKTINIPDTVGYQIPHVFGDIVGRLIQTIPNADKAVFFGALP